MNRYLDADIAGGGKVFGLGASTKGNVLLQFFGITKERMPYISERNPQKVGLRTLGTDFELISEERARDLRPSSMLVLPWYFKNEIVAREQDYLRSGGKLVFPMPYAHVVTKDGEIFEYIGYVKMGLSALTVVRRRAPRVEIRAPVCAFHSTRAR